MIDLPGGTFSEGARTTARGVSAVPVTETVKESGIKVTQTVYVKATGHALPVEIIREFDGIEGVVTFKDWGQPPDATVPKHPTVFDSAWVKST